MKSTQDLIAAIGRDAAMRLCESFGGLRIYIPRRPVEKHPISQCIGLPAAIALSKAIGAETLDVPLAAQARREARNREIHERFGREETQASLARRYSTTVRHVRRILGSDPAQAPTQTDHRQVSLFEEEV